MITGALHLKASRTVRFAEPLCRARDPVHPATPRSFPESLQSQPRQRLLGSFNHASMANALPQALGAQSVDRERQVVALARDGGLMMTLGDLRTAVTLQLPITVIVFNNQSLGLVELEEAEMGIPPTGTTLDNPSFADIGRAMGFTGYTIDTVEQLEPVLAEALATPGPTIVDVHTSSNAVSIPPSPSIKQAWGFATSTLKELLLHRD